MSNAYFVKLVYQYRCELSEKWPVENQSFWEDIYVRIGPDLNIAIGDEVD